MRDGRIHQDKDLKKHETADITELHNAPSVDEIQIIEERQKVKAKEPAVKK
jgi:hypothetical protein